MSNAAEPTAAPAPEPSATTGTRPSRPRLAALDGLRLVAALAVLSYHYTGIRTPFWDVPGHKLFPTLNHLTRYGYLGVELFFMISGFVILMTAYNRSIDSFVASRVARLFPAYWVAILATLTLQQFWTGGRQPKFVDALVNLTMVQGVSDVPNVQGAFWTLWIELKFYLLIGVFIMIGITRRRMVAFAFLWPLLAQFAAATDSTIVASLLVSPSYAQYFAVGICLFLLHREGHDIATWLVLGFNAVLCIQQATGYADRASGLVGAHVSPLANGLAVVLMIAAIFVLTHGPLARIQWRWLTFAGAMTYPLYLVHGQFGFAIIDTLHDSQNAYLVLLIALAVSFVVAYLIHRLIEKPFTSKLRHAVQDALRPAVAEAAQTVAKVNPRPSGAHRSSPTGENGQPAAENSRPTREPAGRPGQP